MTDALDRLSSPRILAGAPGDIDLILGTDGADTPDPTVAGTVTVTDDDGNTIVADTPATIVTGRARLRLTLTAAQTASVNVLRASWSGITWNGAAGLAFESVHEVVGSFLFTVEEGRRFDGGAMADEHAYPTEEMRWARDRITDAFGDILGVELGRRARRDISDGDGSATLWLGRERLHRLRAAATRGWGSQTWTPLSPGELAKVAIGRWGQLVREGAGWPRGVANVKTIVECGWDPIPLELRRCGLMVLRDQFVPSDLPWRATSQSGEFGAFSLATAGRNGSYFGIPQVDEVLQRLRDSSPVAG